jgi:cobalt-zinc-cadmium efflux system membrane fusion protein
MSEIGQQNSVDILLVDDDEVLARVVGRVLSQQGFTIRHAPTVRRALEMARLRPPGLALLDLCLPDGNGVELAASLRRSHVGLPLVLMTAYPLRVEGNPALAGLGARVLTKPFSPATLREAVRAALAEKDIPPLPKKTNTFIASSTPEPPRPTVAACAALVKESHMRDFLVKFSKPVSLAVLILVVLVGIALATGAVQAPWLHAAEEKPVAPAAKPAALAVERVPRQPHTLAVPEDARKALGITTRRGDLIAVAKNPTRTRPLVMPGSTLFDPTRLFRIRARFAPSPSSAEVIEIAQVPDFTSKLPGTAFREIRSGDWVHKDQVLAVFYSVDVGAKKNDLIDALVQKKLDEDILQRARKSAESGVLPEIYLLNALRNVEGDRNAVARAENTLRTWGILEEDIQKVRDEAKKIGEPGGKRDEDKQKNLWPRVELKAPSDGVIVERNVTLHEIVVDNTTNLFQIAKLDKLAIFAFVPEDDLPTLEALPTDLRRWTVKTVGSDPIAGLIDDIGYLIDPNQHTAVVKGHIDNKEGKLRAGQFISATVELPPPADVVEVPTDAVVEDGQTCVVFVQTDPKDHPEHFTMRRVELTGRFDKTVFVRSKPFAKGEQRTPDEEALGVLPKEPLRPGERILQTGVGELKAALLDRESQPEKK